MRRTIRIAGLVAMLLSSVPAVAAAVVSAGEPAPNFSKTDLVGAAHTLGAYAGKVLVLFEVWFN